MTAFGQGVLGDTWEYDGTAWTQLAIAGPPPRTFVKMVYDSHRQRMVLFGGYNGTALNDTWELVNTTTGIAGEPASPGAAATLRLDPNLPNPFALGTSIVFLPARGLRPRSEPPARSRPLSGSEPKERAAVPGRAAAR